MLNFKSLLLFILLLTTTAFAAEKLPAELKDVGITEHLGDSIDLALTFTDETGATVPLQKFFDGKKPVVLTLAYYGCPNICGLLLRGITDAFTELSWMPGTEFEYVNVSIDPTESFEMAAEKKENFLKEYGRPDAAKGWHFLVGTEDNIRALAQQIGYAYYYDTEQKQYAHGAALYILTPDGTLSRYLFGVMFEPRDMRLGLLEATKGQIGAITDHILLFCYQYDPKTRKYSLIATRLMAVAGAITVVAVVAGVWMLRRKNNRGI